MRIQVHATAGARRNHVGGSHDGALRVSVTVAADKGRANKAIQKSLANSLDLAPARLNLISGQTHRRKVYFVADPPADLAPRVAQLMSMR